MYNGLLPYYMSASDISNYWKNHNNTAQSPIIVPVANTNTSMQYIEDHYFHYRTDEETEILSKSRKSHKEADDHLEWTQ